mgnify:CR=1 FL=1
MGRHDAAQLAELAAASEAYFRAHLPDGSYRAWLAEVDGVTVACGGLVIRQSPPTYHNLTGREGYIMGMYTRPEFRRRGLATAMMHIILDHLRSEGIQRATLRASYEGRPLYEKLGFRLAAIHPSAAQMLTRPPRQHSPRRHREHSFVFCVHRQLASL